MFNRFMIIYKSLSPIISMLCWVCNQIYAQANQVLLHHYRTLFLIRFFQSPIIILRYLQVLTLIYIIRLVCSKLYEKLARHQWKPLCRFSSFLNCFLLRRSSSDPLWNDFSRKSNWCFDMIFCNSVAKDEAYLTRFFPSSPIR